MSNGVTVAVYKDTTGRSTYDVYFANAYLHMSSNGALVIYDEATKRPRVIYADATWHRAHVDGASH